MARTELLVTWGVLLVAGALAVRWALGVAGIAGGVAVGVLVLLLAAVVGPQAGLTPRSMPSRNNSPAR